MARVPRTQVDDEGEASRSPRGDASEHAVYGGPPVRDLPVTTPADISAEPDVVADATERNPRPPAGAKVPKAKRYTVTKGGSISQPGPGGAGYRTIMREGKVIDNLNFDIASLRAQGIGLQELSE